MSDAVVPTRRILLFVRSAALGQSLRSALAARGVEIDVVACADGPSGGLATVVRDQFAAERAAADLVVCDCSGEDGLRRAFFVCREAGDGRVALLVLGDAAESGPVETLVAGIRKARPSSRVLVVTDRIGEAVRPAGSAGLATWTPAALAAALGELVDAPRWQSGAVVRLRRGAADA
jgi:hypothetical protein